MKKFFVIPALAIYVLLTGFNFAQDEAMMKAWQEYMTPGPMHEVLAKGAGEWKADITMWMDPAMAPTQSQGTSKCEMIFDGRYFHGTFEGTYDGKPMHGMELSGYDNAKKEFFSTWIDNMGTGIMHLKGTYDEASKTLNYSGVMTDPMGNDVKVREVVKHLDDNTMHFEMYMDHQGQEFKTMEIKYTRVK